MKYSQWLKSLSDRELLGLYNTYCGQSEETCTTVNPKAEAIWLEAFDRNLI